jgi:hypothetical protein
LDYPLADAFSVIDFIPLVKYPIPEIKVKMTAKLQMMLEKGISIITLKIVIIWKKVVNLPHIDGAIGISIFKK